MGNWQDSPASIIAIWRPELEVVQGQAVEKVLTRVMRMAVWVSRRPIGCTPIGTARQASVLSQAPAPATQTPRPAVARACTGCHDGEHRIATPRSGHCGLGHWPVALTESQGPALQSRSLPTAVSQIASGPAVVGGAVLWGAAAVACKVRVHVILQSH